MDNQTVKENKTVSKLLQFDDDFMNRPMIEVKPEEYAYQSNYGDVDIILSEGNNLISFWALPEQKSLDIVFESLGSDALALIGEGVAAINYLNTFFGYV